LNGKEVPYMKTVVIFYSLGGYTKYISEILAGELNADLLKMKKKYVSY